MPGNFFQVQSKKIQTLTEFLESDPLKVAENFLKKFEAMERIQKIQHVQKLIAEGNHFDLIARLATLSDQFKEICNLAQFKNIWLSCWSTYGFLITQDYNKTLYKQPCKNELELFLGIFFYYKAIKVAELLEVNFSQIEINYLKQAVTFNSIHACQRYYAYLYEDIKVNFDNLSFENVKYQFRNIIKNIKQNILPYYGSYAYRMLTETYFYYGIYLKEKGELELSYKANNAALKCLDFEQSERLKVQDKKLYHNASLGSMNFISPLLNLTNLNEVQTLILKQRNLISDQLISTNLRISSLFAKQESQKPDLKIEKNEFNSESERLALKCQSLRS
ncbi:DUF5630 domain-containing protein [Legionella sp. CNM-1927-20]|uniref:DUF5630 domain-containing protein n=1 Tax=Legionella sp. CNM-1927-20 TaxID=3422221 RepID=UPI00403AB319